MSFAGYDDFSALETAVAYAANGALSGTTGESLRLEAIKIELTGADADLFDVYYQGSYPEHGLAGLGKEWRSDWYRRFWLPHGGDQDPGSFKRK
jgi:hypothetical protein